MAEAPDSLPERLRQRKPLIWMGRSRKDIGEFPERVKGELGYGLDLAQAGEKHDNAKPLSGELTSIQVRYLLNLDEVMLSNLSRGRLTELSIEHLFRYLNILGRDLEVVLKHLSTSSSQGKLKVTVI